MIRYFPLSSHPRLVLLTVLLLAVLGGLITEIASPPPDFSAALEDGAASDVPKAPAWKIAALPPAEQFAEIASRPIFSRSRRPPLPVSAVVVPAKPVVSTPPPPPPSPDLGQITLIGTIIGPPGRHAAILKLPGAATASRVKEGEKIGGWVLIGVNRDSVVLSFGEQKREIGFAKAGKTPNGVSFRPSAPKSLQKP